MGTAVYHDLIKILLLFPENDCHFQEKKLKIFSLANRKHGIQSKTHFGQNHNLFIESLEVMERIKYEIVQPRMVQIY